MNKTKYFHCSSVLHDGSIAPQGYYERVNEYGEIECWDPLVNEPPIFYKSKILETCFAKSMAGAIIGSLSSHRTSGIFYLYSTEASPDIDLSDEISDWLDCDVVEEVRYRVDVPVLNITMINISQNVVDLINEIYTPEEDGPISKDVLSQMKIVIETSLKQSLTSLSLPETLSDIHSSSLHSDRIMIHS